MRVTVGKTLTIRGANFSSSRKRNTVLFIAGKRQAFAKPTPGLAHEARGQDPRARSRTCWTRENKRMATRLKLRVVTKRYGKLTTLRLSPIVLSARGVMTACARQRRRQRPAGQGAELKYALDPCKKDTDGDGIEDGWEYWSAKDLNAEAVPFPGKKPYPNPLDGGDTGVDFDGDSLTSKEEFNAWVGSGRTSTRARPRGQSPAGLQRRRAVQPPRRADADARLQEPATTSASCRRTTRRS